MQDRDNEEGLEHQKQEIVYSPEEMREKFYRRISQTRADVVGRIIEKSANSFDVSPTLATRPRPITEVKVIVYPQDPFVSEPEIMLIPLRDIQPGLSNDQLMIQDSEGLGAQPNDNEGNYMYSVGSLEFDQVGAFFYINRTLRMYERYLSRLISWAFEGRRLRIDPHAGTQPNAYYSENEQKLAFFSFDVRGKRIHTSQSPDVVCHEAGHAILDGIRDLYNESFGLASGGIHESFGDISSIAVALQNRSLVSRLIEITGGNLRRDNLVSHLAEELGTGIHNLDQDPRNDKVFYLRNAFNNFTDVPYDQLEFFPEDEITTLGSEGHNYSRLFTGTFYDILIGIYEKLSAQFGQHAAMPMAADIAGRLVCQGLEIGPVGEHSYSDLARAMLDANRIYFNGIYQEILIEEFAERKILSKPDAQSHISERSLQPSVELPNKTLSRDESIVFIISNKSALGIPQHIQLMPQNGYTNNEGMTYLNYVETKRIILDGTQFGRFEGSELTLFGGVSLTFDQHRKLTNSTIRLISDQDIQQVKNQIAQMILNRVLEAASASISPREVATSAMAIAEEKKVARLSPVQGIVALGVGDKPQLIKQPVHVDIINPNTLGIQQFVSRWKETYEKIHNR
jgi:hypothetical protein